MTTATRQGTAFDRVIEALERDGRTVKRNGPGQAQAQCPAHDDNNPSLSITDRDDRALVYCHAGCDTDRVLDALNLDPRDLFDKPKGLGHVSGLLSHAIYNYPDGRIAGRSADKKFRQSGNTKGRSLYFGQTSTGKPLGPESLDGHERVYFVEGEEDVKTVRFRGEAAVCNAQGAGKSHLADLTPLSGKKVIVVADKDEPGRKHAAQVVEHLGGIAATTSVVEALEGKDVTDHVAAGHSLDELRDASGVLGGMHPEADEGGIPDSTGLTDACRYLDVALLLDGGLPEPPTPTVCKRSDGVGLFYLGHYNVVVGDPESGKTLLTDFATVEQLGEGGRVLRLDLDHNGPQSTISRLIDFGANEDALRDSTRFRYVEPEDRNQLAAIVEDAKDWQPTLVVLDSIGELLPLHGAGSNDSDEFTAVHRLVIKPLAAAGACVVGIDHLSKGLDSRKFGPTGTVAKRRVISGSCIRVTVDAAFTPDKGGSAFLAINKDRHGGLRRASPSGDKEPSAGKFVILGGQHFITAPMSDEKNPGEHAPPADVAAITALDPPPASAKEARERLKWRDERARQAFKDWKKGTTR
ncbi:MAG TPA: hypothetical protein PK331_12405 [Gordonia sp. (in: high G+C Gram-positive bacteria)]|uniref:hypothetical protein n=1 Tax=unclassified Gordonia (in: high G+C Gram-positive bacteria) TaxID=2657482 RepID=UPI000FA997A0|nr:MULTISPECIES: hypothetical protein [unclassified Gordonia (in: high G+C Gram-positive bacteria)]RTL09685.1 MAG: hypothetical protein EKK62_00805 [Acidimicrobiia bacterium]HNP58453.1 hypothetical protein [Gordonia sp. (in: high G+C Gram-positive bacteria)]HRC51707.1 hypothetical protein [Gordonia sp. (in: high G+C Gram-positive bacteria)]